MENTAQYPQIAVRQAVRADARWIRTLAMRTVIKSIPEAFQVDQHEVRERARLVLAGLESMLEAEGESLVLVAINAENDRRLGYVMVDFDAVDSATGEPQALIRDIAAKQGRIGEHIVRQLVTHAAKLAYARGLQHIFGEISAQRRESLRLANNLGFTLERCTVAARCGPGGIM